MQFNVIFAVVGSWRPSGEGVECTDWPTAVHNAWSCSRDHWHCNQCKQHVACCRQLW